MTKPIIQLLGPMSGIPESNYPAFRAAAKRWRERGFAVIDPSEMFGGVPDAVDYETYLRASLALLEHVAEEGVLLEGWEKSPGARREVATLARLGRGVRENNWWTGWWNEVSARAVADRNRIDWRGDGAASDSPFANDQQDTAPPKVRARAKTEAAERVRGAIGKAVEDSFNQSNSLVVTPLMREADRVCREEIRKILDGGEASPETVLEEAARITSGDRQAAYGHPRDNHACTASMWSAYLSRKAGREVPLDARDVCNLNALQKLSRDAHMRKRDNLTDLAGWARCAEMLEEE